MYAHALTIIQGVTKELNLTGDVELFWNLKTSYEMNSYYSITFASSSRCSWYFVTKAHAFPYIISKASAI